MKELTGGELLTRALAWVAFAGYAAGGGALLLSRGRRAWDARARAAWTLGCAALIVHAGLAFHFQHGWSHAEAYADTARQTGEATGFASGAGLYLNYALLALWAADVAWWWRGGVGSYRRRSRAPVAAWQGFLLFMFFNAAVVFAGGAARWAGLGVFALLLGVVWLARVGRAGEDLENERRLTVAEE